jgi:hypothetical protein
VQVLQQFRACIKVVKINSKVFADTKAVCVLSNFHDPEIARTVNRRSGMNIQRPVVVPKMLSDYQKNMKGVDLCDQTVEYYLLNHRSKK